MNRRNVEKSAKISCPFCEMKKVITKIFFIVGPNGEETPLEGTGTSYYVGIEHLMECAKLTGTFEERKEEFKNALNKKHIKKNFKSKAYVKV
ncbi:MAG: hypothetical protein M3P22_00635 [bacterium]|nr:hypothetical protein [bacterium]